MDTYALEHLTDLADRSAEKNIYTFSDFLTPEEQSRLLENRRRLTPFTLFGGTDGTERNMARFGSETELGYTAAFPIVCLKIAPVNPKFAEDLTHRDYLGALMSLGIERGNIGDIIVRRQEAYLFCTEKIAPFLTENMQKIRRTDIRAQVCEALPEGALYETQTLRFTLTSLRIDCVLSGAAKLSRNQAQTLFREKKVFLNGAVCEKPDVSLSPGDVFSASGYGKFRLKEITGKSKKGKLVTEIEKYV